MRQMWENRPNLGAWIEVASVLYLALPLALFIGGWFKLPVALLLLVALAVCLWFYIRRVFATNFKPKIQFKRIGVISAVLLIAGWVVISGAGAVGSQTMDYAKHNAVTADLVNYDWPVVYDLPDRGETPLVYYIAYYLPAAAVGKAYHHSVNAAYAATLVWALVGILLIFYWMSRLAGKSTILLAVLLIGFSGLDIIGSLITTNADSSWPMITRGSKIEWFAWPTLQVLYPSHTTSLFWTPQHTIAGWLLGCLLASIFIEKRKPYGAIFIGILGLLWSPFATLGLLPIFVCLYLTSKNGWKAAFTVPDIVAMTALCIPLLLFFQSAAHQPLHTFLTYNPTPSLLQKLAVLLLFILIEFGIYVLLMYRYVRKKESREWLTLLAACCIFLSLLPILRLGAFNDLVMRACVPALMLIAVLVYRFLSARLNDAVLQKRQQLLWMAVGLGFVNPLIELNVHLLSKPIPAENWISLSNTSLDAERDQAMDQYRGNSQSLFFRELTNTDKH